MSDNNFKLVTLVLFFPIFINCMTISVKDSITYDSDFEYIKLSNDFIIESTLKITLNDSVIYPIYTVPIEGKIFLNNIPQNSLLIIEYDCLKKNIPYIVGPKWKDFPNLDTLNIFEDSKEHFEKKFCSRYHSNNIFIRKFFQELIFISLWRIGFSRWCPNGIKWKDPKKYKY